MEPGGQAGGEPQAVALVHQVSSVLLGSTDPIVLAVDAFVSGGHVLFEDVPGVGKTLLAKALARSIGGSFGRVQGTQPVQVGAMHREQPGELVPEPRMPLRGRADQRDAGPGEGDRLECRREVGVGLRSPGGGAGGAAAGGHEGGERGASDEAQRRASGDGDPWGRHGRIVTRTTRANPLGWAHNSRQGGGAREFDRSR